jgi:hypothetical protein
MQRNTIRWTPEVTQEGPIYFMQERNGSRSPSLDADDNDRYFHPINAKVYAIVSSRQNFLLNSLPISHRPMQVDAPHPS